MEQQQQVPATVSALPENCVLEVVKKCKVYIVGTAHVSRASAADVEKVMDTVRPDYLFVELCDARGRMFQQMVQEEENQPTPAEPPATPKPKPKPTVAQKILAYVPSVLYLSAIGLIGYLIYSYPTVFWSIIATIVALLWLLKWRSVRKQRKEREQKRKEAEAKAAAARLENLPKAPQKQANQQESSETPSLEATPDAPPQPPMKEEKPDQQEDSATGKPSEAGQGDTSSVEDDGNDDDDSDAQEEKPEPKRKQPKQKKPKKPKASEPEQAGTGLEAFSKLLRGYYKKVAKDLDVDVGVEFKAAFRAASKQKNCKGICGDRPLGQTMIRLWNCLTILEQICFCLQTIFEMMMPHTEEMIESIKSLANLDELISTFGKSYPSLCGVLVDERDQYLGKTLAHTCLCINSDDGISEASIVAVIGIGHMKGMKHWWKHYLDKPQECEKALNTNPPPARPPPRAAAQDTLIVFGLLCSSFCLWSSQPLHVAMLTWAQICLAFAFLITHWPGLTTESKVLPPSYQMSKRLRECVTALVDGFRETLFYLRSAIWGSDAKITAQVLIGCLLVPTIDTYCCRKFSIWLLFVCMFVGRAAHIDLNTITEACRARFFKGKEGRGKPGQPNKPERAESEKVK
eukprot:TRINITY_DN64630_c0_g2_i1.p1 TRINITY_DN64630_c0_g2~~TRINITY_DN64630_c0_g2_i1.p1  ORF type:complete len:630 (+),score=59.71 TRINITY_DN64630_c0_g2_i1:29-1918(+)